MSVSLHLFLLFFILSPIVELQGTAAKYYAEIEPYVLPDQHPVKKSLDEIFSSDYRVQSSLESLRLAGFETKGVRHWSNTIVATHPNIFGYYFKLFTDDQTEVDETTKLMNRIYGAKRVQEIIDLHHWQYFFKVPRKWIYIIPSIYPSDSSEPKSLILVAEDMHTLKRSQNYAKWRSDHMTPKKLDMIFTLLFEGGLSDSTYPFNLPFCHDGRIAVIDTEFYNCWPIQYDRLIKYLSPAMAIYWHHLIESRAK